MKYEQCQTRNLDTYSQTHLLQMFLKHKQAVAKHPALYRKVTINAIHTGTINMRRIFHGNRTTYDSRPIHGVLIRDEYITKQYIR